jgi:hypothetical protein
VFSRLAIPFVLALGLVACSRAGSAQFRVVGVQHSAPADQLVLHVQVVNKTAKAMRLQRLEYTFAGAGHEVALERREIEPGAAVVVEVPIELDAPAPEGGTLKGKLFAELDQIVQSFPVKVQVQPGS